MAKIPFVKPPLSYVDQIELLKSRGLSIDNQEIAIHKLESISYYRLSGFWYVLLESPKTNHRFKSGSTFQNAFKIYCFDRELRKLIKSELEKIEVAIRAKMIYILSHKYGPFWYTENSLFSNRNKHNDFLTKFNDEYVRCDEDFIKSFRNKYTNPYPPDWMAMEIMSFGSLSKIYENLTNSHEKKQIAEHFQLPTVFFISWLHYIICLRNICAHHSRIWNKTIGVRPKIITNPKYAFLKNKNVTNKKIFFGLSIIIYLLNTINPENKFKLKLFELFKKYPIIDKRSMGFPDDWQQELLWK